MKTLKEYLNEVEASYHRKQYLNSDPLEFVHHYTNPWDQEVVAILAALLAYGNVRQIRNSVTQALHLIQSLAGSPQDFVKQMQKSQFVKKASLAFAPYVHRFNTGEDLVLLHQLIAKSWKTYGSVGAHFLHHLKPQDENIENALNLFIEDWSEWTPSEGRKGSFSYFLTAPQNGSCCKRWCMLLRWMGRKDEVDPGLWGEDSLLRPTFPDNRFLQPKQLIMPLDTHTGRISQWLELTQRKSVNWKAAQEVTQALKKFDPNDPTRYDFALARIGILHVESLQTLPKLS